MGRATISPISPTATSPSSSSTSRTSKSCVLGFPAAPGLFVSPAGSIPMSDASVSPYPPLNVAQPNRSRQISSVDGGIGAAAQRRSSWPAWSGWSAASAIRIASEPSSDTMVAPGAAHLGPELRHREAPGDCGAAAHDQRPDHADRDRVEVEERQGREHHVVGTALPGSRDLVGEGDDVVLREHAALRRTGRPGRVDEAREVARADAGIGHRAVVERRVEHPVPVVGRHPGHGLVGRSRPRCTRPGRAGRRRRRCSPGSRSRPAPPAHGTRSRRAGGGGTPPCTRC